MNGKVKILIVDDEEVIRKGFERTLAGEHSIVECASDGFEALRKMGERSFDVVLLDLRLPEMDGLTVLKRIKQQWPDSEVVVITGFPELETAKESVVLGAYDYLAKPVGPDEVINVTNGAMLNKRWALRCERQAQ
jgi:YesN/AraC family two-component response regulator